MNEPVTIEEAKTQLRVNWSYEDEYIRGLISAARAFVESFIQRALVSSTVTDYHVSYAGKVPPDVKICILIVVRKLYDNPGDLANKYSSFTERMLEPHIYFGNGEETDT